MDDLTATVKKLREDGREPQRVSIEMIDMPVSDLAVLHFKLFFAALPLAATLFVAGFALAWVVR